MLKTPRILVVDDEPEIRDLVIFHLERAGLSTLSAADGEAALSLLWDEDIDLAVLDLMLPHVSGLEVLKALRENPRTSRLPVILLTAKTAEVDKIIGFELGTDDYVTKPFSVKELVSRVQALLRRAQGFDAAAQFTAQGFSVNFGTHQILLNGHPVEFSPREFAIMELLFRSKGAVISRAQILEKIWGMDAEIDERVVDVNVARMREKMGEAKRALRTIKGYGYRLDSETPDEA